MSDPRDKPKDPVETVPPQDGRASDNDETLNPAGLESGQDAETVRQREAAERARG